MSSSFGGDVTELFTGANTAPTPRVTSRPPDEVPAEQWTAPDVSNAGHLTVQHEDLRAAASVIKAHLPGIDDAISTIGQFYGSFDCLKAWPAGQQMCENLMSLATTFESVLKKTSGAHTDTAAKLTATADSYQDAETSSTRAARTTTAQAGAPGSLSALLNGTGGPAPSTSTPYVSASGAGGSSPGGTGGSSQSSGSSPASTGWSGS